MIKGKAVEFGGMSPYHKWIAGQGIPIIRDFFIEDMRTVELAPWEWKGGRGAYLNLIGTGDANDGYLVEIAPGESLKPQRVLFEELVYVVEGSGSTSLWNDENQKVTFEWQAGSLFSPPANTWRRHFNGNGTQPARLLVVTSAPPLINLFRNMDFILNNPFAFDDRFDADPDGYSKSGETYALRAMHVLDTNFIADTHTVPLYERKNRGAGGRNLQIELAENSLAAHISEFPPGTYKKAHRHGPGAHVIILGGEGYSLMWAEGEPIKRFDWRQGSLIVPPERWFHQHFNTGNEPARYMALRWGSHKNPHPLGRNGDNDRLDESVKTGGDQIEYADEDPMIRQLFEEELAKHGAPCLMDEVTRDETA